ncbi:putative Integrase [Klebsormidium nitens]|uniref:Putative Integrase n=1 Tax=Klebsormidium nitens TaxID=105231 RepID=A0A1Y1IKM3_KLENI|nr:putative Integrase [Klebsormidium nitens]|eukprot:GAQ91425.1 putative Integrase [Klebsormidium nitens]
MGSRIWAHLTAAATNAVGAAANIFAMVPGNEAPNKHGAHHMVGTKEGASLPDRPARLKRTRAAREGDKQEQPRKTKKRRKSSAAAAEQMGARTEVMREKHVSTEQQVEVGGSDAHAVVPQEEYTEMALDVSLEPFLPPKSHYSPAVALWEQVAAAEMEASQAVLNAKHLREEAERAERGKGDLPAHVAVLPSSSGTAGPLVDKVSTPIQATPHPSGVEAYLNGGLMTKQFKQQRLNAAQKAGPSVVAAPPVFQSCNLTGSTAHGKPQRIACLGLEAPPNPLCPDLEADPEEDGSLTSAYGGALGSSADFTVPSDGRRQYGLRSRETDRKGKAKVSWDAPSSSHNSTVNEAGPSAVPANTPGNTLEYDDVMSRVMPAHARFNHGPSRLVRVTRRRKPAFWYAAKVLHLSPETQADLARFHAWLRKPPPTWQGGPNCKDSAVKIVDRIRGMLGWLSYIAKLTNVADVRLRDLVPSADVGGATLAHEHVKWLADERAAVESTLQCVYRSLLHLAMYLYHTESNLHPFGGQPPYGDVAVVAVLRSHSGLLQRKAKKAPKVADQKAKLVAWPVIVGVVLKELRAECAGLYEKGSPRKAFTVAKSVQKYLIAAILACCGDRQRTIRELKVGETLIKENGRWVICLQPKHHKTGGSGAERPKIPLPTFVSSDMDAYLDTWREYLRPEHKFVFCSATGRQLNASGLCHSFSETVFRITGLKMNPHLVRTSIVMHFRAQATTDRELEALALCMGHSVAVQRTTYDLRSVDDKAGPALAMVEGAFEKLMCIF